jgi:hypothetical protein
MTRSRALLIGLVLVMGCSVVSAQEGPGAGKLEFGLFPGGGLWLVSGDGNTEVNFDNFTIGGGATWYVNPMVAIEGESFFGVGRTQNVEYQNRIAYHVKVPHTVGVSGNIVIFPGGSAKRVAGYVAAGAGTLTLVSREQTNWRFGLATWESFLAPNVGGGVKIFRGGDVRNWGFRIDYRLLMVNRKSDAAFFAQSKRRLGHRFYMGLLYTMKR